MNSGKLAGRCLGKRLLLPWEKVRSVQGAVVLV